MIKLTRRTVAAGAAASLLAPVSREAMAQVAEAAVTRALPRTYAGTTVRLTWGTTPSNMQMAEFAKRFTEASGINLEFVPLLTADRYTKMVLDLSSNTNAFDIYLMAYQWKEQVGQFLVDLTHIDQEVKGVPAPDWSDYPPRALEAYGRLGDRIVAAPFLGDASMLVWNRKALREAGMDGTTKPKDWETVYQNGTHLVHDKQYGFNMPAGKSIQTACVWIALFHAFGGSWFDQSGRPAVGSPAGLQALRFMVDKLGKVSPPGNLTWDFPEMINALASGQTAQGWMWTGGFSTLFDPAKSAMASDIGWSATPQAVLLGGWGLAINAHAHNLDAAKLFIGWFTSPEIAPQLALVSGSPCRTSAFRDPEVIKRYPVLPAVLEGISGKVAVYCPIKESEQINIMIYDEANAACSGTKTPEQAIADLQDKVTTFMKRRGLLKG